ncbi:E3 SUMO-protein ligase ZBED1-like [Tachypleus tridentatus]|uniref:E3 SUMO-protein ligase ZBED1-like n=1 Tax=Tachypleus tridentatus TaxID=6853 RepID=UPI003FD4CF73
MHSNVLGTRLFSDRHTGQNIASEIHNLCSEFLNTNNIVHLTTDNAANMLVAAEKLGISHSGCFAHSLQLALQDGLKLAPIAKALGAGRRLVTFFNHSVLATSALKQKQVQMATEAQKEQVKKGPIIAKNLIQDCPTRWNSELEMVQRLVELRVPIYAVLVDATIVKSGERFDIDDVFWDTMHTIIPILHPFAEATEILGKEDLPTGSSIYPLLTDMMEDLKTTEEDKALAKQLKKQSVWDCQRKELHANIAEEIRRSSNTAEVKKEPEADEVTEPPVKKPIMSKVLSYVMGDTVDLTEGSDVSSVEEELADFVREPLRPPNPLQWWSVYRSRFPSIASVARKYLSIPGTSVPSERTFSTAGLTVSKLRASLNPEHVDQLVFLNKNLKSAVKANMTVPSDFLPASDALPAVTVTCTPCCQCCQY